MYDEQLGRPKRHLPEETIPFPVSDQTHLARNAAPKPGPDCCQEEGGQRQIMLNILMHSLIDPETTEGQKQHAKKGQQSRGRSKATGIQFAPQL